ncbi:MAG: hemolysin III family protein [Lachnospiraceae bacterium]|nr:hemolysin III family protein [Lachnospiraceae bacterium]
MSASFTHSKIGASSGHLIENESLNNAVNSVMNTAKDQLKGCADTYRGAVSLFSPKDPISALTHFIGFWLSIIGMPLLLVRAAVSDTVFSTAQLLSLAVFMLSMILLYGASTSYHTFRLSPKGNKVLKKIDHMMICVLIAGSYTPVCAVILKNSLGLKLLIAIWVLAAAGILFKAFWVTCPKWVSSLIYISMGWTALFVIVPLFHLMSGLEFGLLLGGGILYTIGGVIYALRICFNEKFTEHELFHIFVLLGSFCHYLMMFSYVS